MPAGITVSVQAELSEEEWALIGRLSRETKVRSLGRVMGAAIQGFKNFLFFSVEQEVRVEKELVLEKRHASGEIIESKKLTIPLWVMAVAYALTENSK